MEAVKVDAELAQQMQDAASANEPMQVVFRLRPDVPGKLATSPEKTEQLAQELTQRVSEKTGMQVGKVNVFRNLGSFFVSAAPGFIRELINQPEIASAIANRRRESAYIAPVSSQVVDISTIGHETAERRPSRRKMAAKRR
jgi:hypothetical protein